VSLLRDIQETAVGADSDVATLLRKCKILAARLGNAEFKQWVDKELNGYDDRASLPSYRILHVQSVGDFSGPFGRSLRNAPIPISCLPEEWRDSVRYSYLMQPIGAYTSLIAGGNQANAQENWLPELVARFGGDIYQDMNCLTARKIIPYNAIAALIDTIKTRVLSFCLEIEAVDPDVGETPLNTYSIPQDRIAQVFNTYISGTVQNVATGGSQFRQQATTTLGPSEDLFRQLLGAITSMRQEDSNAPVVARAVEAMRDSVGTQSFGSHYQAFMSLLSDHIQVYGPIVAPYLSALAAFVSR